MSDQIIDLTKTTQYRNSVPVQEIMVQAIKKFDVNFEEIKKEVIILNFQILQSQEKDTNSIFAEYESVSYKMQFLTYNVEFLVRLLTFHNDSQSQILKLDIQPKTTYIKKEIEYCCNSLQRRRNLNLMFKTLIIFARFIESRRLICDLVLKKNRNVKVEQNKDGGIIVVYADENRNARLGIFWSIACTSKLEIRDVIEVYYKFIELPNKKNIWDKLNILTEPCLDFTKKYHMWKSLIDDLSRRTLLVVIDKMPDIAGRNTSNELDTQEETILPLDSEEFSKRSLVVVVDKMPTSVRPTDESNSENNVEREAARVNILSDCDDEDGLEKEVRNIKNKDQAAKELINYLTTKDSTEQLAQTASGENPRKRLFETTSLFSYLNLKRSASNKVNQPTFSEEPPTKSSDSEIILKHKSKSGNDLESSGKDKNKKIGSSTSVLGRFLNKSSRIGKNLKNTRSQKFAHEETEISDCSNLEIVSKKWPSTRNLGKTTTTMCLTGNLGNLKEFQNDENLLEESFSDESSLVNFDDLERNSSDSDDGKSKRPHFSNCQKPKASRYKRIENQHHWGKNDELGAARKSPHLNPVNYMQEINYPIAPTDRTCDTSPKPRPDTSITTQTFNPKKGLVLISDNTSFIKSVVPNNFLSVITPKEDVVITTPPRNVRVGLVPDKPISSSPSFLELNLVSPPKKPKVVDEDLEITSVTYIVPD